MKTTTTRPSTRPSTPNPVRLEERIARQQQRINNGVRTGALTADEARQLQGRLDGAQADLMKDGFEGKKVRRELKSLSKDIFKNKHNADFDPAQKMKNLDARLEQGAKDGTLTPEEQAQLKAQADAVRAAIPNATTPEAKAQLQKSMAQLSRAVKSARHNDSFDGTARKASFDARIQAGERDGSLTAAEAAKLRADEAKLDPASNKNHEAFDRFSRDLFKARHNSQLNVPQAVQSMSTQIDALQTKGVLTATQATQYKTELSTLSASNTPGQGARLNALRERLQGFELQAAPQPVSLGV
ncbi:MAG: hypothetical protein U0228_27975 [Myxococcaceae bacterium]